MQTESTLRKRKACLTCTRAKAKCTPSGQLPEGKCQRCLRLCKECVYEDCCKKPGPKSRSRVKQLEKRVESLIDLITVNNGGSTATSKDHNHSTERSNDPEPPQLTPPTTGPSSNTSNDGIKPPSISVDPFEMGSFPPYDPIKAGVISEERANRLVSEFKNSFTSNFPFVVLDDDATASTLRHQQPFLLHAVLAVASYETPVIQCVLGDEFRRQIAQTVEHSCRSLEILQGLLVYLAWYHTFYHPKTQQMALIVQMCVALVQDLALTSNRKQKAVLSSRMQYQGAVLTKPEDFIASKRALLGTFYMSVCFAQAWRKRASLTYTRYMAFCCESFKQSTVPTDALISPMIQLCELWCRVNDYFSYDDMEYTEIHGEMILNISSTGFRREVQRIKDSTMYSPLAVQNTILKLMFSALEIQIDECCLHSSLWRTAAAPTTFPPSTIRLNMLDRTMRTAMTYMQILLDLEKIQAFQLSVQAWTAWFHIIIVICKLVFLRNNERLDDTLVEDLPAELNNMLQRESKEDGPPAFEPHSQENPTSWEPLFVARQYNIQARFEQFVEKLRFSLPAGVDPWSLPRHERNSLHSAACIQHMMLSGFTKAIKRCQPATQATVASPEPYATADAATTERIGRVTGHCHTKAVMAGFLDGHGAHPTVTSSIPFASYMDFSSISFEGVTIPSGDNYGVQQQNVDDWMWNTMMDDFSMPTW
ncbi:hypothetical protein ACN47E_001630 [Coniothyrium glycines]